MGLRATKKNADVMPKTIRVKKRDMVRAEIIQSAARLFAQRGYRAVTTDEISEAIGLTKSAMYYYFKNKYELLSTIFSTSLDYYLTSARAVAKEDRGPVENLRRLIRQHALNAMKMREWTLIYFREESELNQADMALATRFRRDYSQIFAKAYRDGVAAKVFKDVNSLLVVNGLIGACNSIVRFSKIGDDAGDEAMADTIVDILASGYETLPLPKAKSKS